MTDAADLNPEEEIGDVPEGAAVFPEIPEELGVNPLLLAVLHATVFLAGSDEDVVDAAAADEAVGFIAMYLSRLKEPGLTAAREDMACLVVYARQQGWPKQLIQSLKEFLTDFGVGSAKEDA
jgi:hypothetical protein